MSGRRPTAKELLQRREEERRVDALREALTSLRGLQVRTGDEVLTEWSREELAAIGRSGSTPDATLAADADPGRLGDWLAELERRSALGDRIFLGTSARDGSPTRGSAPAGPFGRSPASGPGCS
jgi:hypothetical protein